ncbi:MAG: hypothetical protein IJJ61_06275 [Clostridia bacterium]|nr:hypothetical protein [Clostridia bacterium]
MKKLFSLVLALLIGLLCLTPAFAAESAYDMQLKTSCGGDCGYSPVIIIPGIMQSQTYVQDKNGNDIMTSDGFPIVEGMDLSFMFDTVAVENEIKAKMPDILKAILKRDRSELLDVLIDIFDKSFADHYFNPDGTRVNPDATDKYPYSLEECKKVPDKSYNYAKGYSKDDKGNTLPTTKYEHQYDFIYRQVNIEQFCEKAGYDHAYYYAYSSFGNILEDAAGLNDYIDMVKAQTGHDKVSLVFISLGGTIANTYLADYIDESEIDRIILAAAALDGSYLLGDLMDARTSFNNGYALYNDLIPGIVEIANEEYMALAYMGNTIARAIPQEVFSDFLQEALERGLDDVLGKCIRNCQSMWALVPSEMYPAMAAKYISDSEHAKLKEMTDRYWNIQKNAKTRLKELDKNGVDIFVITGYNLQLPAAVEHYNISSDNIIQAASTSAGAKFAPLGSPFAGSYTPAIDASYLDPGRLVDAGTCALPDKTFFVKNQSHLKLQSAVNDVIGLCVSILTDKSIKDARANSGGYRQFNEYRDLSAIEDLMRRYNEADKDALKPAKREKCDEAYAKAEKLLAKREWSQSETEEVEQEFYKAMEKAKLLGNNADSSFAKYSVSPFFTKLFKAMSDLFAKIFGGNDFWLFFIPLI